MPQLTKRELEIIDCIARGLLSKQVAIELKISVRTVDAFRRTILQKFHAKTMAEVIAILNNTANSSI